MKKIKILFTIVTMSVIAAGAVAADGKIAYVDTQAVFDKTKLGQKYQNIVREYYTNRKKILDSDAEEIQKLQEDYKKQSGVMNEKARREKEEFINRKYAEFDKKRSEFGAEVGKKQSEVDREFNQILMPVLKDIAKKEKISLVLNKTLGVGPNMEVPVVLHAEEGLDITDKVIAEMDKRAESK